MDDPSTHERGTRHKKNGEVQADPTEIEESRERKASAGRELLPARPEALEADSELENVPESETAMRSRLGLLVRLFLVPFFRRVRFPEQAEVQVRRAAERGVPVYVWRTASLLSFLYLNFVCIVRDLPLARFANDLEGGPWSKLKSMYRRAKAYLGLGEESKEALVSSRHLSRLVAGGHPVLLFMRRRDSWRYAVSGRPPQVEVMTALVEAQRRMERPILLIPQVMVWTRRPDRESRTLLDVLFGHREDPGPIRHLGRFLMHHRRAALVVGEPLNLQEFLERAGHDRAGRPRSDAQLGRMLRLLMLMHLGRELRVVQGPNMRPRRVLLDRIVGDPEVQEAVSGEARRLNVERRVMDRRVRRYLDRISADISMSVVDFADFVLQRVWARIYDGIVVNPEEMERLRVLSRRSTVVLVPCHRSHVDYLLVSDVLYTHDLAVPHIAAGINLSFWPLGAIFRRMGAFFIQRSFKDDRISPILIKKYVSELLRQGHTLEFFIEGGRSRTGLLLRPKLGILSMIADHAVSSRSAQEVVIVPVSIGYDRVVEAAHYVTEALGGKKRPENFVALLRSARVLRDRYGKVHLGFLEPVPLQAYLDQVAGGYQPDMDWDQKKAVLEPLACQVLTRIAHHTPVTAPQLVAAALLNHTRRGILDRVLLARVETLLRVYRTAGQPTVFDEGGPETVSDRVEAAISLFIREKCLSEYRDSERRILAIVEQKRFNLDYYKNSALTPLVPDAMLAQTVRVLEPGPFHRDALLERFAFLHNLLADTFVFDLEVNLDESMDRALTHLEALGAVERHGWKEEDESVGEEHPPVDDAPPSPQTWAPGARGREELEALAGLLHPYLEAFAIVLRTVGTLRHEQIREKDLHKRLAEQANAMYMTEEILRKEATNQVILRSALGRLKRMGVFHRVESLEASSESNPRLALDTGRWTRLQDTLQQFLDRGR